MHHLVSPLVISLFLIFDNDSRKLDNYLIVASLCQRVTLLSFSINCTGQSSIQTVEDLFTKPQQWLGQDSLFANCEGSVDKKKTSNEVMPNYM